MSSLTKNFETIRKQLASHPVTLVAVSKTQSLDQIEELYHLGQRDFGENYVQELCEKAIALEQKGLRDVRWHFIGHLQTNKIKILLRHVAVVHTVDSMRLATELAKRWPEVRPASGCRLPVFIEVNLDHEPEKYGLHPERVLELVNHILQLPALELQGLMCIPKADQDPRPSFIRLRQLLGIMPGLSRNQLSMGMSNDYLKAAEEGATHVRIGSSLFGARVRSKTELK